MPSPISEQVKEFEKLGIPVKTGIRQIIQKPGDVNGVSGHWVHRWAKHACQNYPIVVRSYGVRYLKNACVNLPAFVVGIGPSLDDNVVELKQAQGRAIIIATDAALRPLLARDIRPDLVVSFDCKKEQNTLWDTVPAEQVYNMPLIINSCTHPDTIVAWKGPVLFYNQWHRTDEFTFHLLPCIFPNIGSLPSAGTVGNMAVLLAHHMGCNQIYTMGFDLCYLERGGGFKYRCQDFRWDVGSQPGFPGRWATTENKILYDNDQRLAQTHDEKVRTQTYKTDDALKTYRECLLGLVDGLSLRPVDLSVGGVLSEYFRNVSVTQAVMESCRETLQKGRSTVFHLHEIAPRGTLKWEEDRTNGSCY